MRFYRHLLPVLGIFIMFYFSWQQGMFDELLATLAKMNATDVAWLVFRLFNGFLISGVFWLLIVAIAGEWLMKFKFVKAILDVPALALGYTHDDDLKEHQKYLANMNARKLASERSDGESLRCDRVIKFDSQIPADYLRYFISYTSCYGIGCVEIGRSKPIRGQADIVAITEYLNDYFYESNPVDHRVVITSWKRFEPDAPDGARDDIPIDVEKKTATIIRLVA